jgi:hypothetical protein
MDLFEIWVMSRKDPFWRSGDVTKTAGLKKTIISIQKRRVPHETRQNFKDKFVKGQGCPEPVQANLRANVREISLGETRPFRAGSRRL